MITYPAWSSIPWIYLSCLPLFTGSAFSGSPSYVNFQRVCNWEMENKTKKPPCNKDFLSSYDVPGTVPGAKERLINKTENYPTFMAPSFIPGGKTNKQMVIRKNKAGWWPQGLQTLCHGVIRECFRVTELQGKPKGWCRCRCPGENGPGGSREAGNLGSESTGTVSWASSRVRREAWGAGSTSPRWEATDRFSTDERCDLAERTKKEHSDGKQGERPHGIWKRVLVS